MSRKLFFLFLLLLIPISASQLIDVNVVEDFKYKIMTFTYNENIIGLFNVGSEFFNPGSVGYSVRARLDIFNGSEIIYSGWAQKEILNPGQRHKFVVYWLPKETNGNLSARLRFYLADEIQDLENVPITISRIPNSQNVIELSKIKVYDDKITFNLRTNMTVGDVVIMPYDFPKGWIAEQKMIENVQEGKTYRVELDHQPSAWQEAKTKLVVVSLDGKFYGEKEFILKREEGFSKFVYLLREFIRKLS